MQKAAPSTRPSEQTIADGYHRGMKKLIVIAVVLAIGAIIYKVLTTEVPIDEA